MGCKNLEKFKTQLRKKIPGIFAEKSHETTWKGFKVDNNNQNIHSVASC